MSIRDSIRRFYCKVKAMIMVFKCSQLWWDIIHIVIQCKPNNYKQQHRWPSIIICWRFRLLNNTAKPKMSKGQNPARMETNTAIKRTHLLRTRTIREDTQWISRSTIPRIYTIVDMAMLWYYIKIKFQTSPKEPACRSNRIQRTTETSRDCYQVVRGTMLPLN